jgi:hypothetical protein
MEEKRMVSEADVRALLVEAVRIAKIEAFHVALKIHADAFSRGSMRVALYNQIMQLEGSKERA